jgi:16S rRNA (guanine966-N2)-methyltransferase
MSILRARIPEARVLDLFAGSGALGLECLSRGAAGAVFVEKARGALAALERNVGELAAGDRTRIVRGDAFRYVEGLEPLAFDLALADPPYDRGYAARLLEMFRTVPFARELWVEHRTDEKLPQLPGMGHRRYGDTTLTWTPAPE